jgi:hypothetical protein
VGIPLFGTQEWVVLTSFRGLRGPLSRQLPNSGYLTIPLWFQPIYLVVGLNVEEHNNPQVQLPDNVGPLNAATRILMITVQIAVGRCNSPGGSPHCFRSSSTDVRWLWMIDDR